MLADDIAAMRRALQLAIDFRQEMLDTAFKNGNESTEAFGVGISKQEVKDQLREFRALMRKLT